uniref:Uncharacterized protein n=1 Tax=Oryza glaberrima TaxID=4538 RepID=I1PD07_ORYGL
MMATGPYRSLSPSIGATRPAKASRALVQSCSWGCCGSCSAFAMTGALESHRVIACRGELRQPGAPVRAGARGLRSKEQRLRRGPRLERFLVRHEEWSGVVNLLPLHGSGRWIKSAGTPLIHLRLALDLH